MDLETADVDTLKTMIELSLQDLNELQTTTTGKGKRRDGEQTDLEVAIATYIVELSGFNQLLLDRTMCASIADAVRQDAAAISEFVRTEEQARNDHHMASALNEEADNGAQPEVRPSKPTDGFTESQDDDFLDKLSAIYISDPEKEGAAESSAWAASRPRTTSPCPGPKVVAAMRECVICTDQYRFFEVATFPCQHHMCQTCLTKLFTDLLKDQTLFPPRCCHQPISLDKCRFLLEPELVGRFLAKKLEYETVNQTYCSRPTCSLFIPQQAITLDVGTCVKCRQRTCVVCKGQAHVGTDCPEDSATKEVLQLAGTEGWMRCYSCKRMVDLVQGCNHITCPCGAQFCYACGQAWKKCNCEVWSEEMLAAQANRHVNRDAGGRRLPEPVRQQRVAAAARHLIVNHQCHHRDWGMLEGQHQCELCRDFLPAYLYECRQCRLAVCRSCRFQRL
ncbi:hypothetical protein NEUTE1DRAFT_83195 [Neurospora tetrasperma FGSC 2508]|uniref:RBR-type E3 ubiquitin transferase n=1 Tax=Neurospora tetrasperma (strain FGSC 2508 / ATCC MYA-4615 / P0657) TaxID=510951 RepID=F8MNN9_NEUT8|nr:uncharacterized protein NEUTE1DRAFT_83195 [Neurospora tetrasperma FGSC 2508]EGO56161.1 hypothetical protein NEUTE1DRAFT_83195 [Neurospora tetrasperma FGSC 2508]